MQWYWQNEGKVNYKLYFVSFQLSNGPWLMSDFFPLISWEQIDGFRWNFVYAVVWLTHKIFPNFSTLLLIDVKISIFLNIFRSNEWILINCVYALIYICSMLWLIHTIFPNFSTELWPLIDNLWIWSNLVDTLIFICQNMRNNKTKYSDGLSCSACNVLLVTEDWFKYNV